MRQFSAGSGGYESKNGLEVAQSEALDEKLSLWSWWMRKSDQGVQGYPRKAAGFSLPSSYVHEDLADMLSDSVLQHTVRVIDACVDSLPRDERLSIEFEYINKACGAKVFSHPLLPKNAPELIELTDRARTNLIKKLTDKGILL